MAKVESKKYQHGKHPNTLANLTYRGGRPKDYGEEKKRRTLTVTESGWEGAMQVIETCGCNSISEFLEQLGRGQLEVSSRASWAGDRGKA